MEVTVIIPVYNAASFIEQAVESALMQTEVKEIILIDDGSSDTSPELCRKLSSDHRVVTFTHPGHTNLGVSATRNLGIEQAQMPFIAFLDADDVYLADRFTETSRIFRDHPDADGVYESVGAYFYDPSLRPLYLKTAGGEVSGVKKSTTPDSLFRTLASGRRGYIHLNGLTIKREVLQQGPKFDTSLTMSEDVDLVLQLAAQYTLYGGPLDRIVALRGIHGVNSIFTNPDVMQFRRKYLQKCIDHDFYGSEDMIGAVHIINRRVGAARWYQKFRKLGKGALPFKISGIAVYLFGRPGVMMRIARKVFK